MTAAPLPEVDRRRLLEVRGLHPAVPVLVLHPLLTVVTGFGREASDTVVECLGRLGAPLGPTVTGTVEIGGRILDLPGALSDPDSRPEVIRSPMIVGELGRRRAAHAAADMSQRAARVARREAGLARRDQLVDRLDRLSSRADALERQVSPVGDLDDEIEALLRATQVPETLEPNPIAATLINEWEALVVERRSSGSGPTVQRAEANVEAVRARIAERRLTAAGGSESEVLSAEGVARVQECHGAVERIAASMEEGRRAERKAAGQKVAAALDAERDALTDLGFDSYAAFLLAMAEGRAEGDRAHDLAALHTAEAALQRARERAAAFVKLSERELDLRARVARLLGRLPGPDVGAELRTGRDSAAAASVALERLANVLRNAGAPVGGDPIAAAEQWLRDAQSRRSQRAALMAELAEIESEGSRLDEQLEEAENELAVAERELIAGVSGSLAGREAPLTLGSVEPDEVASTFATLAAQDGPPVIVGECFTELTPNGCAALLEVIAEVSRRRQVVIVTEHEDVGRWAQGLGIEGAVWTPTEAEGAQRALRSQRNLADAETVPVEAETETAAVETEAEHPEVVAVAAEELPVEPIGAAAPEAEAEIAQPEVVPPDSADPEPVHEASPVRDDVGPVEAVHGADTETDEDDVLAAARAHSDAAGVEIEAVEAVVVETPEKTVPVKRPRRRAPAEPAAPERAEPSRVEPSRVEPSRAEGPWKAPRRGRRKKEAAPPPQPWEGRFDTSRQRALPTVPKPSTVSAGGSEPLAVCARHRGVLTRMRCDRCGVPACDECLVTPKGKRRSMCVECAILESGVRTRRRNA